MTTNIFMLLNLRPISGFILEIKSIPNYLQGHTVAAMYFNMGHLVKKSWVKMTWNLKIQFLLDLKRAIFYNFFSQIPKLFKNYSCTSQITKHEKDSPRSQPFFHMDNFS